MNGNTLIFLGLALILLSFALPLLGATIIYTYPPEIKVYPSSPSGSSSDPTPLVAGETINIIATVRIVNMKTPTCKVMITGEGFSGSTVTLSVYDSFTEGQYTYYIMKKMDWAIPNLSEGTVLTFEFYVEAEKLEEEGTLTDNATSYGSIVTVNGEFYINGELATETSRHVVYDPTLTIEFKATSMGSKIAKVYIHVLKDGRQLATKVLDEVIPDEHWKIEYTLPEMGTYEIKGLFDVGSKTYRKMSVLVGWGESQEEAPPGQDIITLQNVMFLAGIVLLIVGYFKRGKS